MINNGQKIKKLIQSGKQICDVAYELGVGYSTVMYWIKKNNINYLKRSKQKTARIHTISKQQLQKILNQSSTNKQLFEKLGNGFQGTKLWNSTYRRALKDRIEKDNLDNSKFIENNKEYLKNQNSRIRQQKIKPFQDVFCQGSKSQRQQVKQRIIKQNLIEYVCKQCRNNGSHNGKQLILQLQHINGISDDNRLQNLCFLCPNCHSQTNTFSGRNKRKESTYCQCGNEMCQKSIKCHMCNINGPKVKRRKFNPTKEQLELKLKQFGFNKSKTGLYYGVSDNAIKKRMKSLNIV